jgi:hypothetical protein
VDTDTIKLTPKANTKRITKATGTKKITHEMLPPRITIRERSTAKDKRASKNKVITILSGNITFGI